MIDATQTPTTDPLFVSTLDRYYPLFDGLLSVNDVAGSKGTAVRLRWNKCQGNPEGLQTGNIHHVVSGYDVYQDTSASALLARLNANLPGDVFRGIPSGEIEPPTEAEMPTVPNSTYFFAVRCKNTQNDPLDAINERNEIMVEHTTELAKPLEFNGIKDVE